MGGRGRGKTVPQVATPPTEGQGALSAQPTLREVRVLCCPSFADTLFTSGA